METFKASNGRQIEKDAFGIVRVWEGDKRTKEQNMLKGYSYLNEYGIDALREFFLHERDTELGRWRSPKFPDVVVYPLSDDVIRAFNEVTGNALGVSRGEREPWSEPNEQVEMLNSVGDEYFAAHPAPKPWHDAKPDEVWAVTWDGTETLCKVILGDWCVRGRGFKPISGRREMPGVKAPRITAGRRIWPEVE